MCEICGKMQVVYKKLTCDIGELHEKFTISSKQTESLLPMNRYQQHYDENDYHIQYVSLLFQFLLHLYLIPS